MTSTAIATLCAASGLKASTDQAAQLTRYLGLLRHWNSTYNLTSHQSDHDILGQHLADCLAVVGPVKRQLAEGRLLDVGSGGGLPGIVIAVMAPGITVTCIDAVGKKAAFIKHVAAALGLSNLQAVHGRVEHALGNERHFDVITCRAFASLRKLVRCTAHLLRLDGVWIAMKGATPDDEMDELGAEATVFHVEQLFVPGLPARRCLVWMRHQAAHGVSL